MRILLSLITLQFLHLEATTNYKECILQPSPTVRSFRSLIEYQGNKVSFNANSSDFLGNYVKFDFVSIDKLVKNSFITFDSDKIISLNLSKKGIQEVDDGAFLTLFCLHFLDLSQNRITYIHKGTFEGIENIRELNLSNNAITFLTNYAFVQLKYLRILDISQNYVTGADALAMHDLLNIEEVYLGNNEIKSLPKLCYEDLRHTKVLDLQSNHFEQISFYVFAEMDNLEKLDLSNNNISSLEFANAKCDSLRYLNLSNNYLNDLNITNFEKSLSNLSEIDINENKFQCLTLHFILDFLKTINIKVSKGRSYSSHQINDIYCIEKFQEETTPVIVETTTHSDPWETIKLHHWIAHSTTNWLILLFCIIAGLGVIFVLDFFFAKGSIFSACNRGALIGRYGAPPPEYVPLNGR